ncbi:MAG: hypothetical protein IT290_02565 [Deltaproteobacteria bacterium]|nr:hypothetical protein [Deltaproteobacteria bacterium]
MSLKLPMKFRELVDIELSDVEQPDTVWLANAACALTEDACGWSGWILDGVFKTKGSGGGAENSAATNLPSPDDQICPRCGKALFRTGVDLKFSTADDQSRTFELSAYETEPIEFIDATVKGK